MSNIVAIVGRPNVGKSTLFNRLVGGRKAIVNEESGVTRDRNYGKSEWNGKEFSVIDTGGYVSNSSDIFEEEINKQVLLAMDEADVILFVCDVELGITDLDHSFARMLRKVNKPIYLVANKVDNGERLYDVHEFYKLGVGEEIFPIASINGSGTGELLDKLVSHFTTDPIENMEELPKIAIVGRPNVGKSSLMNALIGEKVSIVSPKAQTTRDKINGILTTDEYQMIFIDTPGVHKPKNKLGKYMENCVRTSSDGVDAIVVVFDVTRRILPSDTEFVEKYLTGKTPVYLVLNKIDEAGYEKVYPLLEKLSYLLKAENNRAAVKEIIPVSAKKGRNVDVLKKYLVSELKEGPCYYPSDEITDKSERYMISEIIREKALMLLDDEIPHGIGVEISNMFYDEYGTAHIFVDVIAEKDSHKAIIIGAGGEKLKMIAERARKDVEKLLSAKVYMELFVKVRENWRNNALFMSDIGYDGKKLK